MKLLVVGCGSIGARHLRLLHAMGGHILLAYDPQPEGRARAEALGALTFGDYAAALAAAPDAALICSPTHLHAAQARQAAEAGCHLFVEKPLSHTLEGMEELLALCAARALRLMVGYPMRFQPGLRRVKEWLEAGEIGRVLCGTIHCGQYMPETYPWKANYAQGYVARREWGGGVTLDASHELDYAGWLFGPACEVSALADTLHLQMETEDVSLVTVRYAGGALFHIHLNYLDPVMTRRCEITGTEGMIRWEETEETVRLWTRRTRQWRCERVPCPPDAMYRAELTHFLECVQSGQTPLCDGVAGREAVAVALAALQSSAQKRVVAVTELLERANR
ncbi:MAG TPA: Gfo/Idh/MocA family oxidoreductase [Chthonomonadaceae bacterium]|nr:Gfo/Idh/MocA family oxidoreductase [Chthonomonadaceae bacterium]